MTLPAQTDEDAISTEVLRQLSQTPYACSSLAPLSSRPANFVYRGILTRPLSTEDEAAATSIIIKYSTDLGAINQGLPLCESRCIFEESFLNSIANFSPPISPATTTVIKTPRLFLFNQETHTQVHEDIADTVGFKLTLFSPAGNDILPRSSRATIARQLGAWLRSFHTWASAPAQATLRSQMLQDDPVRKLKCSLTYDGFLGVLENYPDLLENGEKKTLGTIRDIMVKEFTKLPTEENENWGLIHGDIWSGNILIPATPWLESPESDETNKLFIIDWEFAQFGHRCYDLGQLVGDLYERKLYNNNDTGVTLIAGIIDGYGKISDELAFRTAIHVGVHVIGWYNRRPRQGPWFASPEAVVAGLTVGKDFIIKGWEKDRNFFKSSVLAPLFAAK